MGNKIGRRKQVVDEKYTRPQGLYQHQDIDQKKLRKLILDAKLAPCYPGDDDGCTVGLEECLICFLHYPSLNRSKCCTKGICTECFLQLKPTYPTRPTQCPFCKTLNYAVEYRGAKTKEEKIVEQVEEQRVIEAQIRIQQQTLQDVKERMQDKEARSYSTRNMPPTEAECQDLSSTLRSGSSFRCSTQDDEAVSSEGSRSASICARPSQSMKSREDNSDLELEDVMLMEAIWLSIQEQGIHRSSSDNNISNLPEFNWNATVQTDASSSSGLTCRVAALSQHQHLNTGSTTLAGGSELVSGMMQCSVKFPSDEKRVAGHFPAVNSIEDLPESRRLQFEQDELTTIDLESNEAEAETNRQSSNISIDLESAAESLQSNR